jgi:secernin
MCDCIYASSDFAGGDFSFFAKNSDRNPAEPQIVEISSEGPDSDSFTTSSGRVIPVKNSGFACLISRPAWMWGAEMGINARGVAIGNEAAFSRSRVLRNGILGMDILRMALRSSETAREAVDFITDFVSRYDQGGNAAYRGALYYHNNFMVADYDGAWVVETSAREWAVRKIEGAASMSNAYSIGTDYDETSAAFGEAQERAAGDGPFRPDWKKSVASPFFLRFTRGETRAAATLALLERGMGSIDIRTVFSILRSHNGTDPSKPGRRHMESICVHSGGFPATATTGSLAVQFDRKNRSCTVWFTGTPYPCVSLFKPVSLSDGRFFPVWNENSYFDNQAAARDCWAIAATRSNARGFNFEREGERALKLQDEMTRRFGW